MCCKQAVKSVPGQLPKLLLHPVPDYEHVSVDLLVPSQINAEKNYVNISLSVSLSILQQGFFCTRGMRKAKTAKSSCREEMQSTTIPRLFLEITLNKLGTESVERGVGLHDHLALAGSVAPTESLSNSSSK